MIGGSGAPVKEIFNNFKIHYNCSSLFSHLMNQRFESLVFQWFERICISHVINQWLKWFLNILMIFT